MKRLAGKVAIITGAGQGVGLGIAQVFADHGAALVISGRDAKRLDTAAAALKSRGAEVLTVPGDVRKRASANATVEASIRQFGKVDILVNNAQSSVPGTPLEQIDDATIALTIESGLLGTLYHMQAVFAHMKANGGSIINHKIRVNVVCPAALSPAAVTYLADHPTEAEMYKSQIALGYFGDPFEDIGPIVLFLASAESRYLTGQTLNADGGQQML
jgi:NAD(P)-dependent dehydrogenase (short-subunit alcohol dehydrogenase family)